ncbi:MAG: hypothetical protein KGS60_19045 [Verrucomicrobia bacterium]|nr:hypothetical protein [Verrucomicrobiota bacterium]
MSATAQKLPPLMHFPLAKHLATTQGRSIRRVGWTGKPGAHELAWIRYTGGLWWYQNASGERVAESGDVDEHDLLALDWTTLAPHCDPAEHQDAGLPADATVFGIRPYDLWEDVGMDAGLRELTNPNAVVGAARCQPASITPLLPPVTIVAPVIVKPGESSGNTGGTPGSSAGGTGIPLNPPGPQIPGVGTGSGSGTVGTGGSGGGSPNRRRREPTPPAALPTASLRIATGSPIGQGCIQRAKDECGRRCRNAPDPVYDIRGAGLAYEYLGATISLGADQDQPGSVWFYRYYYKGELRETGTMAPGSSKNVDGGVRKFDLAVGASHSGRVEFGRGSDTVSASDTVTMPDYCQKDPDCGKPCGGGGGGGGGGSDWGGSW